MKYILIGIGIVLAILVLIGFGILMFDLAYYRKQEKESHTSK